MTASRDATMDTFTVRWPWGPSARLFGRNPLVRTSDRVEALILVLAVVVTLIAVPIAAAVGTAVYDSRSRLYAEQAQTRQTVTATVTGNGNSRQNIEKPMITVPARWFVGGAEHTGDVVAQRTAKVGDQIQIWVDDQGSPVGRPTLTALDEAVAFGAAVWCGVAFSAAAVFVGTRIALDRARYSAWQRDFDSLVGHR